MFKLTYKIGLLAYCCLMALALIFYKERTVFLDIAYHLFYIIKDGDFAIQNYRFGAVFTQVFPLVGYKLGLPLKAIMVIYSLGFIIYYFSCYLICGTVLKQYRAALMVLLLNILFVADSFFWMQSELPQGLAFMVVMLAFISGRRLKGMNVFEWLILVAGMITVGFFHPLLIFPVLYFVCFAMLGKDVVESKTLVFVALFFFILAVVAKNTAFKANYDSNAMEGINNFKYLYPNYFTIASNKQFLANCVTKYYWIPVLGIMICVFYALRRKWVSLVLFVLFAFGYLLLVNVSYHTGNAKDFYIENLYLPVSIIIALAFVYDVLPALDVKKLAVPLFSLILITGVLRIYGMHNLYSSRLEWIGAFYKANMPNKLVMHEKAAPMEKLLMSWGSPYEFWLLSTVEQGETASILIYDHEEDRSGLTHDRKSFATTWGSFPYEELDSRYFKFTDTVNTYKIVE